MTALEQWRQVPDYPDFEVSDLGRVRSQWPQLGKDRRHGRLPEPVVYEFAGDGYRSVRLKNAEGSKTTKLHWVVLQAFVGPRPHSECRFSAHVGRHLNDIRADNRLVNLAWGTRQDNCDDARRNKVYRIGQDRKCAKLTEAQVLEIYGSAEDPRKLALRFDVHQGTITQIQRGKSWTWLTQRAAQ